MNLVQRATSAARLVRWSWLVLSIAAVPAFAASPRGTSVVGMGLIFTDNLFLSPTRKESDVVLQVRPMVSLSRRGARVNADVDFAPVGYLYSGHQELNDVQFVLDAGVSWEVVDRWFFLDFDATANQAAIDPSNRFGGRRSRTGFDSVVNSEAFAQVATISVKPRLEVPIVGGRFATVKFAPGVGTVLQASTADSDAGNRTGTSDTSLSITSGAAFVAAPWNFEWRRRVFGTGSEQRTGAVSYTQGYVLNRRYRLDAILGYDEGTYVARTGADAGFRWELRLNWTPKPESAFHLGFGDAFFGPFWSMSAQYRQRRWALLASYRVSVESSAAALLGQQVVPRVDLFGNRIENPLAGDDVVSASISTPRLTDEEFLSQQFQLAYAWKRRRNGAQLQWTGVQRDYADGETRDHLVSFNLSRSLSRRLYALVGIQYWSHAEDALLGNDFTQEAVAVSLAYRLGPKATLSTRIGRQSRDSAFFLDSFSEHRLSIDLSLQL